MKKIFAPLLIMAFLLFGVPLAWAQTTSTGLLPTNPFYFLKEWKREIRLVLSVNTLRKAEVALGILNERLLEINKLKELGLDDTKTFANAVSDYRADSKNFADLLKTLSDIEKIEMKLAQHILINPQYASADILQFAILKTQSPQIFTENILTLINDRNDGLFEWRVIESLEKIDGSTPLLKLKEDLLLSIAGRLETQLLEKNNELLPAVENLSGDLILRVRALDQVRETSISAELKSALNHLRQNLLDRLAEVIDEATAQQSIKAAQALIGTAEALGKKLPDPELVERAKFNIEQAVHHFENDVYYGAFGQASVAASLAQNAIIQYVVYVKNFNSEVDDLKLKFDRLSLAIAKQKLDEEDEKAIKKLLKEAEERIIKLSQLAANSDHSIKAITFLRKTKLLLVIINELRRN